MSQRDKYIESVSKTFQEALDVLVSKSGAYATEEDPFKNYRGSAGLAGIDVQRWFIANMAEKLIRMENLLTVGMDGDGPTEPFNDSIIDLCNQAAGLKAWRKSREWRDEPVPFEDVPVDPGDEQQPTTNGPVDFIKNLFGWEKQYSNLGQPKPKEDKVPDTVEF